MDRISWVTLCLTLKIQADRKYELYVSEGLTSGYKGQGLSQLRVWHRPLLPSAHETQGFGYAVSPRENEVVTDPGFIES